MRKHLSFFFIVLKGRVETPALFFCPIN